MKSWGGQPGRGLWHPGGVENSPLPRHIERHQRLGADVQGYAALGNTFVDNMEVGAVVDGRCGTILGNTFRNGVVIKRHALRRPALPARCCRRLATPSATRADAAQTLFGSAASVGLRRAS
ncbi:MAG: hypothetical protein AB1938_18195 [Myxococcota bacterium]